MRRELSEMPFDKCFCTDRGEEMLSATGDEVFLDGMWWNEYVDSEGVLYYG